MRKWRGQQYSVALFPLWIKAVLGTVRNVYFGRDLPFVVTPKTRQVGGSHFGLVRWQVVAMLALVSAAITGLVRLALGINDDIGGVSVNLLWVGYDLAALSVVIRALRFRPAGGAVRSNDAERDLRVEVS